MKNNGFTLIELLGIIILLSVIVTLSWTPLSKLIKNTQNGIDAASEATLIDGAAEHFFKNKDEYPKKSGDIYCMLVQDLIDLGEVPEQVKDKVDVTYYVKYTYSNQKEKYEIVSSCSEVKN